MSASHPTNGHSDASACILKPAIAGNGLDRTLTILLPIWHNISKREVMGYSASLADRLARSTSTHTVEEIAAEIVDVIRGADPHD